MNKTLITIVTAVLLLLTSAQYVTPSDARVGFHAPDLMLNSDSTSISLQDLKGKYVVVTFWSSEQPVTRIDNARFSAALGHRNDIEYIAVNMDRSQGLFEQLITVDMLDAHSQFYIEHDAQQKVIQQWRQQPDKFSSFLIDPQGFIVKANLNINDLAQL